MKPYTPFATALLVAASLAVSAQQSKTKAPTEAEEKREIVIEQKKNGQKEKMVIEVNGDKITINGKPIQEYQGNARLVIGDEVIIRGRGHVNADEIVINGSVNARSPRMAIARTGKPKGFLGVVSETTSAGAKITEVVDESAAQKAGLQPNDVITMVGNTPIKTSDDLTRTIGNLAPETTVDISYQRNGKAAKVKATLGKAKEPVAWSFNDYDNVLQEFRLDPPVAGVSPNVRLRGFGQMGGGNWDIFYSDQPKYGMSVEDNADGDGVRVDKVDENSQAATAGLKQNDIITAVDGTAIKTVDQLKEILASSKDKGTLQVAVQRGGKTETLTLRVPKKIKTANL